MGQLNNLYVSSSFQGLLKLTDSTQGLTNTLQTIQGGDGSNSPLQMSTTQVNISGSLTVNGQPISIETGSFATTGSNTFIGNQTITGSIDITGQYLVNGVPVSGDRNGLITTGSISTTQQITGSLILGDLILSGNFVGNSINNGLIKIKSEAYESGSIQFENSITSSAPISQSNFIFGSPSGAPSAAFTGSVIISGSNNIIFNGTRTSTLNQGTLGYIQGNNNIIGTIPTISTSSFLNSLYFGSNANIFNSILTIDAPATGAITSDFYFNTLTNNNLGATVVLRHKSGSFNMTNNNLQGVINSFATQSLLYPSGAISGPTIQGNVHAGGVTTLSHISSSIIYFNNISDSSNLLIRNSATHPLATNGSGSVTVANNIFGGSTATLTISGSGAQNTKGISNNIVVGNSNELNIIVSGSNSFISNTGIIGTSLIVSGSNGGVNAGGSTFVGRFNATGSLQESTNETVFVVGTGTNAGNRRNALRIDSNNNSNFTGSVNVSGSVNVTGSLTLNGVAVGSSDRNGLITTGSATTYPTQTIQGGLQIISGSLWAKGRNSLNNLAYGEFALASITTAGSNTGLGNNALSSATTGGGNLAVGGAALPNMTTAINNVAIGNQSQLNNISGSNNTAIGANTLQNNVAGFNLAIGTDALKNNTTGQYNNAIGDASLYFNTIGEQNTAIGKNTLFFNTTGGYNLGIGGGALSTNVSGSNNVAIGGSALQNSVSSFNLAIGGAALNANTTGQYNVGIGQSSFQANTIGEYNTAIGWNSGVNNLGGSTNTIIGAQALQDNINGSGNVAIGRSAGFNSTGSNGFYVGNENYGSLNNEQNKSLFYGQFNSTTANQSLQINANTKIIGDVMFSSGSNKTMGTVALDGGNPGSATVSNSLVTANSIIFLTKQTLVHPNGYVAVSSKGSGTFTITSNHNGDTDTVAYQIINPA